MQWDWGNIALAIAALMGLVVWVFQFCCMAWSEASVPGQPVVHKADTSKKAALIDERIKRLAVIRSSAQILLENREADEVNREMCRFIIEETEQLTSTMNQP